MCVVFSFTSKIKKGIFSLHYFEITFVTAMLFLFVPYVQLFVFSKKTPIIICLIKFILRRNRLSLFP